MIVAVQEAEAKLEELVDAALKGEDIQISDGEKPLVRLVVVGAAAERKVDVE